MLQSRQQKTIVGVPSMKRALSIDDLNLGRIQLKHDHANIFIMRYVNANLNERIDIFYPRVF